MKLYQAILAGCQLTEKGEGNKGMIGTKRCALGAALRVLAPGLKDIADGYFILARKYPWLNAAEVYLRNDGLNGHMKWTREEIAYWIRDTYEGGKPVKEKKEEKEPCLLS